ncbi:MAG TPA: ABC transporter substrate-binding protein [Tissierellaceae bacterium]
MRRDLSIIFLILLLLISLLFIDIAVAKNEDSKYKTTHKIGVLVAGDTRMSKITGLIYGLYENGYNKGDFQIIIKNAKDDKGKLDLLSQELVNEDVDIIVTTGAFETLAVKKYAAEKGIPVVFIGVSCAVELGIVEDKISPGCNVTGVDSNYVRYSGKRLEFLKRLVPSTKKVLVIFNPLVTPFDPSSKIIYEAADKLDIDLVIMPATNGKEIVNLIKSKYNEFDGILLMCNLLLESTIKEVVKASLSYKIPIIGVTEAQVKKGLLAYYGSTNYSEGFQAARLVANILDGQEPENIPIETPESLELHINVKTAIDLGIEIDYSKMTFVDKFVK